MRGPTKVPFDSAKAVWIWARQTTSGFLSWCSPLFPGKSFRGILDFGTDFIDQRDGLMNAGASRG